MTQPTKSRLAGLDLSAFDGADHRRRPTMEEIDQRARLPRRDPEPEKEGDDQVNIRGRMSVIRRFKRLAKEQGLSHVRFLEAMLDDFENHSRR